MNSDGDKLYTGERIPDHEDGMRHSATTAAAAR
jgi:hypothetical protein